MRAIELCRTAELGGHVDRCDHCGKLKVSYNSCRNRHCPKCQGLDKERWLEARKRDLLPTTYFHVVFTLPDSLRPLALRNQEVVYNILFKAASETLRTLTRDPKHLGAEIGFIAVLHTWSQILMDHPHLHCIVPAGGLSTDRNKWLPAGNAFYLPVRALSKIFRAKFRIEMARQGLLHKIAPASWQIAWNVNCQAIGSSEATLKYLAPYIFRVAISDSRIMAVKDRTVTFSYRKKGSKRDRNITLDVIEFIRRFLQHVLPAGFMKLRHYGFMNSNCAISLARLRLLILDGLQNIRLCLADLSASKPKPALPKPFCPACGGILLYLFSLIPGRHCRGPT